MADELRYITFDDRGTMTCTLGSLTANTAVVTVNMIRRTGGYIGSLPAGLAADLYGIRYQSSDSTVDYYEELDTRIVATDGFTAADRTNLNALASTQIGGRFTPAAFLNVNFSAPTAAENATAVQNLIKPQLDDIETFAETSALPVDADSIVISDTAIATYTKGGTERLKLQLLGSLDEPNFAEVRKQIKLPL